MNKLHSLHQKYRPDIDGLRAIAIIPVVLFHAFPNIPLGGFIGVDIFFVISGYLITNNILSDLDAGTFRFSSFYDRRIRRIFPALLLVLFACLFFGWFFLLADEYKELGLHIAGGSVFISNLLLWSESGYFDADAATKPLLNLWSLGIEEQFYILWPLVLWLSYRKKFNLFFLCAIIFAGSFILNLNTISSNPTADFYSPLTRLWELMAGSALAFLMLYKPSLLSSIISIAKKLLREKLALKTAQTFDENTLQNWLSIIGFLLIAYGFITINKIDGFPGKWALIPVVGTVLIIYAGQSAWINCNLFSNRIAIFFGLISYPLYLWHWPMLTFVRIIEGDTPQAKIRIFMVLLSVFVSWITFKFVERPLRSMGSHVTLALLLLMATCGTAGIYIFTAGGVPNRDLPKLTQELDNYNYWSNKFIRPAHDTNPDHDDEFYFFQKNGGCFTHKADTTLFKDRKCGEITKANSRKPRVLLLGDSYAAYLGTYLDNFSSALGYQFNQFEVASTTCNGLFINDQRKGCISIDKYIENQVSLIQPKYLIVYVNYFGFENKITSQEFLDKLIKYKHLGAREIIVIGQIPRWNLDLPKIIARKYLAKHIQPPIRLSNDINPASSDLDQQMKKLRFPNYITYISLWDFLCDDQGCLILTGNDLKNDLLVWDTGHLTISGARHITENLLRPLFKN